MNLIGKGLQALRGARKLELFLMIILIAVAVMLITGNSEDKTNSGTGIESRLQNILECMEGVGRVRVAINNSNESKALGVLVVAEGADNMETYLAIQQAVSTFVGIDISGIEIIEMEGK